MTMQVKVRFFALARDLAGSETVDVSLPENATVGELRAALAESCPDLCPILSSLFIAVGDDYADDETRLQSGDAIACFPPVSGG